MRILVYDVAASSGGALTVLNSFYEEFCKDTKNEYIFVLSVCELKEQPHIKVLNFRGSRRARFIGCILIRCWRISW